MGFINPQVSDFKARFVRDFPYGTDPAEAITDGDLANAFADCNVRINPDLFPDQSSYTIGYLLLTAHCLVMNIRASSQGLVGQYNFAQTQKSAGNVSESFQIPQRFVDNPQLMMLTKTNYGAQYLEMILPYLVGQVFTVAGRTKP